MTHQDLLLQVTNPRGVLDESQAGALEAAAALFSLEAGGPESGASLDVAMPAPFGAPAGRGGSRLRGFQRGCGRCALENCIP